MATVVVNRAAVSVGVGAVKRRAVSGVGVVGRKLNATPPIPMMIPKSKAMMQSRRHRCHSCAPFSFSSSGSSSRAARDRGMFVSSARSCGRTNFRNHTRGQQQQHHQRHQQPRQMQFSTKAPHQKPQSSSAGNNRNNNQSIRTILSSSSPNLLAPTTKTTRITPHPLLRLLQQSLNHALLKPRSLPLPRYISPQHYSFTLSECFGHASFMLVAASYATQDFLELRILAVVGSTSMLFFTYFHPHGRILWLPLKWNVLFIAINSYRIGKVLYDRYMADQVGEELKEFREEHLNVVDKVDYWKLVRIAKEEVFEEGDLVLHQGCANPYIRLILEGELEVLRDGTLTYVLATGNFVSESGLHAGLMLRDSVESCGTIVVGAPFDATGKNNTQTKKKNKVRCLKWNRGELMDLLESDKALENALKAALSWDIVRKLKIQRHMLIEGRVKDPTAWTKKREDQGISRYASILQNMLQHPEEFANMNEVLTKYRRIHHIEDKDHYKVLAKYGWTEEEFREGKKRHMVEDDEDIEEEFESARWRRVKRYSSKLVNSLLQ